MKGSSIMTRSLYRSLLWLHPPAFRREFGGEMLWIFDEAAITEGSGRLLADGVVSLFRQWMVGSGMWKVLAGMCGAMLQIFILPLATVLRPPAGGSQHLPLHHALANSDLDFSRALALVVIALVLSTAGLCVAGRSRVRRG